MRGNSDSETPRKRRVAEVAIDLPIPKTLHYLIPESLWGRVTAGTRVVVPVGKRKVVGHVVDLLTESPVQRLKEILEVPDEVPTFSPQELTFLQFISSYYFTKPGNSLRLALFEGNLAKKIMARKKPTSKSPPPIQAAA